MRKYLKYLMFLSVLFINPLTIKAQCGYSEKVRLQKIASNVNFSYDYIETKKGSSVNNVEFIITIANIHPDIYIEDTSSGTVYTFAKNSSVVTERNYSAGINVMYKIYGKTKNCNDELLLTNYVNTPNYNRFYNDEACRGIENHELCQKWSKVNLNYSDFVKKIDAYKKSLIVEEEPVEPEKKTFNYNFIYFFISKYYFIIMISIIVVCLFLMYRINKKNSFDLK
ncbi:MAG: hypothetical protein PHD10_00815 [Bacilli bacterium]|nr:hypothetical protein [Bacilli bacterium]MDD4607663.1 hypothetical protein [Bacilli bacterium]